MYYLVKVYVGVFNSYLLFRFRDYLVVRHQICAHAESDSVMEDDVKKGEPIRPLLLLFDERLHYSPNPLFSGCNFFGLTHGLVWLVVGGWWWLNEIFLIQYPLADPTPDYLDLLDAKGLASPEVLDALVGKVLDGEFLKGLAVPVDFHTRILH